MEIQMQIVKNRKVSTEIETNEMLKGRFGSEKQNPRKSKRFEK